MARPSKPLISRAAAVAAAIEIIDDEGLEAFSLPRLARALGVKAPSLYHHFADKSEILCEVAKAIVYETRIPRDRPSDQWQDWLIAYNLNFRDVILRHRNAAPVLLQFLPRDMVTDVWEQAAVYLEESGVPIQLHVPILDGTEKLTMGITLTEAMRPESKRAVVFANVKATAHPVLSAAEAAHTATPRQRHEKLLRSFLYGVTHEDRDEIAH
ncbi:TetR family transcriptional regulator [Rhodococcus sp. ARC_M6]|uniref:TetR family transcriptional regulator n=1 Tax=Rhodococcus sp. ARC_M6 TaxID=2928852 RepID=UPI001FB43136|nr:TetR family transcriptional regulator [Rhodococcus sp. ARC_M6]MCJ0902105.1 TetR family transcriptional regulator [Rhodococcus sp. ARC_M6]